MIFPDRCEWLDHRIARPLRRAENSAGYGMVLPRGFLDPEANADRNCAQRQDDVETEIDAACLLPIVRREMDVNERSMTAWTFWHDTKGFDTSTPQMFLSKSDAKTWIAIWEPERGAPGWHIIRVKISPSTAAPSALTEGDR